MRNGFLILALWIGSCSSLLAQEVPTIWNGLAGWTDQAVRSNDFLFDSTNSCEDEDDHWGLQVLAGAYFSPFCHLGPNGPDYNFIPVTVRLGRMHDYPWEWMPGHGEVRIELQAAAVTESFGNFWVGASLGHRHYFLSEPCRWQPYWQWGLGVSYNDGYRDRTQSTIGQGFEFLISSQFGVKYFVSEHLSLDVEGGYIHISNANLAPRNGGVNAMGASAGFTYHFARLFGK